mgnify:CR=1 FL=1
MKAGRIVRLRVNPADCMGVADVLSQLGMSPERFSFDQACRIALSSLLESARVHGAIPRRDGFEYTEMMSRFIARVPAEMIAKLQVTKLLHGAGDEFQQRPLVGDAGRGMMQNRFGELMAKQEKARSSLEEAQLTIGEVKELAQLTSALYD